MDMYFLIFIVVLFSVVQSIFGVGLLLFGTPTLLLFGYSYGETLWILLPSSVAISAVQIIGSYDLVRAKREVYFFTIPALVAGLMFIMTSDELIDIGKIVGGTLLFVGMVRLSSNLQGLMKIFIKTNIGLYYLIMGGVHGISNMGGGPLSVLMTTVHSDKDSIRTNIAYVYLIFGISQLTVLFFLSSHVFQLVDVWFSVIALSAYFLVGRVWAQSIDVERFHSLITVLILIYGAVPFLGLK